MKPLTRTAIRNEWRHASSQMLILDKTQWALDQSNRAIMCLYRIIGISTSNVRSLGGVALPRELWDMIFAYAFEDLKRMKWRVKSDYVLVQGEIIRDTSSYTTLRCVEVDFESTVRCGSLDTPRALTCVNEFIRDPSAEPTSIYTSTAAFPTSEDGDETSQNDDDFSDEDTSADEDDAAEEESEDTEFGGSDDENSENEDLESEYPKDEDSDSPGLDNDMILDPVDRFEPTLGIMSITPLSGWKHTFDVDIEDDKDAGIRTEHNAGEESRDMWWEQLFGRHWQNNFLFHKVGVPDIIAQFEGGKCDFCYTSRFYRTVFYLPGHCETIGQLMWLVPKRPDTSTTRGIVCPVCVDLELAERHLKLRMSPHLYSPDDWEQFLDDFHVRKRELDYTFW